MKLLVVVVVALVCALSVSGDVYMHVPRGSNNRLNEKTANRQNGNRLFDSQNNNKGGYNVGDRTEEAATKQDGQYQEIFYAGSKLRVEWTNQHGCGMSEGENEQGKCRCELIYQFMCDPNLRNGINTGTPNEQDSDQNTGRHESPEYYAACKNDIQRNQGLFTADQKLNGDTAIYTRQNPNGGRSGLECPEERDYYPWWHDNPFRTIAVMSYNRSRFGYYEQIVNPTQKFNIMTLEAPWSRQNHLGNSKDGRQSGFWMDMPNPRDLCDASECKCIARLRYNISTADYAWNTDASQNGDFSPVRQNPTVDIGVRQGLKLAINTAQTGRTFQDRSHIFWVKEPPAGARDGKIWNLNVQGKRGNIVQTYPATEYDFKPTDLKIGPKDYVHIQWTGSNTHNNNAPAGDGQAGDAGEGTGGTDRSNIVQIKDRAYNFPLHADVANMWTSVTKSIPNRSARQLMTDFATAGKGEECDNLLNNAPASYNGGLLRFEPGTYHYMCTRNNNFSNRSQKATITVGGG